MTPSPSGTRVTDLVGTIIDFNGQTWRFAGSKNGKGWNVFRDGVAMGTRGVEMLYYSNTISVRNGGNLWVTWGGARWINIPGDPSVGGSTNPVNCVLTEEFRLAEAGLWSTCQPDGTQHRSETWVKDIITPAENGGADCGVRVEQRIGHQICQYIPPSAGAIVYIVAIGTHTHQFSAGVPEMQAWVANFIPTEPEPLLCTITWRNYAGEQQFHQTATFAEFKTYIAAFVAEVPPTGPQTGLPFPGQAQWKTLWPNYNSLDLSQAPAGWVSGEGYPERRAFVEGQWWFSTVGNIDASRHIHVGCALPDVARGVVELNVKLTTFHWEKFDGVALNVTMQGLYSVQIVEGGVAMMAPAPISEKQPGTINVPITQHIQEMHIPVRFDTRGALTDGWKSVTLRVDLFRSSDQIHHLITLRVPMYLDNGGGRAVVNGNDAGTMMASGWMTEHVVDPVTGKRWELNNFNYIEPSILGWNPSNTSQPNNTLTAWRNKRFIDDVATSWAIRGSGGTGSFPLDMMVTKNPNWHAHPPVNGIVKVNEVPIASSKTAFTIPTADFAVGDSLVIRVSDRKKLRYGWVLDAAGQRTPRRLGPGETVPVADQIVLTDPDAVAATVLKLIMGKAK